MLLSGETSEAPVQRPDGSRIKVRFPPVADKAGEKILESELSQTIGKELQNKSPEDKLDVFGVTVYSHCLSQFGGIDGKEIISSKRTKRQSPTEVPRPRKNAAQRRFKAADDI